MIARAFAWLTTNQPLAKDYERLIETGEMPLYLSMSRILLPRLATKKEIFAHQPLSYRKPLFDVSRPHLVYTGSKLTPRGRRRALAKW